ncbi:MAG: hypothetical protein R3A13_08355 [Bdellovibrionota bacterium]
MFEKSFLHWALEEAVIRVGSPEDEFVREIIKSKLANESTFHNDQLLPLNAAILSRNFQLALCLCDVGAAARSLTTVEASVFCEDILETIKLSLKKDREGFQSFLADCLETFPKLQAYIARPLSRLITESISREFEKAGLILTEEISSYVKIAFAIRCSGESIAGALLPRSKVFNYVAGLLDQGRIKEAFLAAVVTSSSDFDPHEKKYKLFNDRSNAVKNERASFEEILVQIVELESLKELYQDTEAMRLKGILLETRDPYKYYLALRTYQDVSKTYNTAGNFVQGKNSGIHLTQLMLDVLYGRITSEINPILYKIDIESYEKDYHQNQAELLLALNVKTGIDRALLVQALTAPQNFRGKKVERLFENILQPWARIGVQNFNFLPYKFPARRVFPAKVLGMPNECLLEKMGWEQYYSSSRFKRQFGPAFSWTCPEGGLSMPGFRRGTRIEIQAGTYFELCRGAKIVRIPTEDVLIIYNKSHKFGRNIRPYSATLSDGERYGLSVDSIRDLSKEEYKHAFQDVVSPDLYSMTSPEYVGIKLTHLLDQLYAMETYMNLLIFDTKLETAWCDHGPELGGMQFFGGRESRHFGDFVEMVEYIWKARKSGLLKEVPALAFFPRHLPQWRPCMFEHKGEKIGKLELSDEVLEALKMYAAGRGDEKKLVRSGVRALFNAGVKRQGVLAMTEIN